MLEYKKVIEPVKMTGDASKGTLSIYNGYDFSDLKHLSLWWKLEHNGEFVAEGGIDAATLPEIAPGKTGEIKLPVIAVDGKGEFWWTFSARLADKAPWGEAGHEVAWTQFPAIALPAPVSAPASVKPVKDGKTVTVGPATFNAVDGQLVQLGGIKVDGAKLDIWRAITDNDRGISFDTKRSMADEWYAAGFDRVHHRIDSVAIEGDAFVVATRAAPAIRNRGLRTVYRWTAPDAGSVKLSLSVEPEGDWGNLILPRLGVRFGLPKDLANVEWFGCGPNEAYADTRTAAKVGKYAYTIDAMQTPYVFPQENGSRIDVRWAEITGSGPGLRVEGEPLFALTARRWTTEQLDKAKHTTDLVAGDNVWLNVDLKLNGIGTGSCGEEVLVHDELFPAKHDFSFVLRPLA